MNERLKISKYRDNIEMAHLYQYLPHQPYVSRYVNKEKTDANLSATKKKIVEFLLLNMTIDSTFLTLTFRENVQDYDYSADCFKYFLKSFRRKYGYSLSYLAVKELQKRGAIHYHIIIFNPEFSLIPYKDIYDLWGNGGIYIEPIKGVTMGDYLSISGYFSKYLVNRSKGQLISRDKRLFSCSRDVKRPVSTTISPSYDIMRCINSLDPVVISHHRDNMTWLYQGATLLHLDSEY